MSNNAKPKSGHLPKSAAGDFATIATDSAQSLIKSRLAENLRDGPFSKSAVFPTRTARPRGGLTRIRLPDKISTHICQTKSGPLAPIPHMLSCAPKRDPDQ